MPSNPKGALGIPAHAWSGSLKPGSLRDAVIAELRRLYREGFLRGEDRLPSEAELAKQLGVGRSSVREAISTLQVLGIVTVKHGVGTFLSQEPTAALLEWIKWGPGMPEALIGDLVEARLAVEVSLVSLATERATEDELRIVREALTRRGQADSDAVTSGLDLHLAIADASHSPVLRLMLSSARHLHLETIREFDFAEPALREEFFRSQQAGHERIVEAMEARDADRAATEMREHLVEALRYYRLLESIPPPPKRRRRRAPAAGAK